MYNPDEHGTVQDFCSDGLAPAKFFAAGTQPRAHWLYVQDEVGQQYIADQYAMAAAVAAGSVRKQQFLNQRSKSKKLAAAAVEDIYQLAVQHGCAVGKWMLRVTEATIDHKWLQIATSVVDGSLGACGAKVGSGVGQETFLVCVYVPNFEDETAVRNVLQHLRGLDKVLHPNTTIYFKADILTDCGIDSSFYEGVRVSRWTSRWAASTC